MIQHLPTYAHTHTHTHTHTEAFFKTVKLEEVGVWREDRGVLSTVLGE